MHLQRLLMPDGRISWTAYDGEHIVAEVREISKARKSETLSTTASRKDISAVAAADRAAAVRKIAADGLIKYRNELELLKLIAELLVDDLNAGVRGRLAFLMRVAQGE